MKPCTGSQRCRLRQQFQLFSERAAAIDHDFSQIDSTSEIVADICRELNGIPLALELAAARVQLLGLTNLRSELEHNITVLSSGNRDVPTRQQTLEATLEWSFDLLDGNEQLLFSRLSAFVGGWTIEAAREACADDKLSAAAVVGALLSLVEKSLVGVDLESDPPRYYLLQIARVFALAKAEAAGETARNAERHAMWAASLTHRYGRQFSFLAPFSIRVERTEIDNLRAAIEWSFRNANTAHFAARIIASSSHVWWDNGLHAEYLRYVRRALATIDETAYPGEVARL